MSDDKEQPFENPFTALGMVILEASATVTVHEGDDIPEGWVKPE